jgi:hypothetical protein
MSGRFQGEDFKLFVPSYDQNMRLLITSISSGAIPGRIESFIWGRIQFYTEQLSSITQGTLSASVVRLLTMLPPDCWAAKDLNAARFIQHSLVDRPLAIEVVPSQAGLQTLSTTMSNVANLLDWTIDATEKVLRGEDY